MTTPNLAKLPPPFDGERFERLRTGIFDDSSAEVFINANRDFAFLNPLAELDYRQYQPRVKTLDLQAYKKDLTTSAHRYEKLAEQFTTANSVLEIGAGDGSFLDFVHDRHGDIDFACVEPDQSTKPNRDRLAWLTQYDTIEALVGGAFDLVCLFHVLEHIVEPRKFVEKCARLLTRAGKLVFEVPSLDDPLLSLYQVPAYEDFFFQRQHPMTYTAASLRRLLECAGFDVCCMIPHQRYGLENHLNWLRRGKPGGDKALREMFSDVDEVYRRRLEIAGYTDAVIAVAARA